MLHHVADRPLAGRLRPDGHRRRHRIEQARDGTGRVAKDADGIPVAEQPEQSGDVYVNLRRRGRRGIGIDAHGGSVTSRRSIMSATMHAPAPRTLTTIAATGLLIAMAATPARLRAQSGPAAGRDSAARIQRIEDRAEDRK